jgi:hypothetical protein
MTVGAGRIGYFDTWQPTYGGATVRIYRAGTTKLANVYEDLALTQKASNPQTLERLLVNGVSYGRWTKPLYTNERVVVSVEGGEDTAVIQPPITKLSDEIADNAVAKTQRGSRYRRLIDRFNDVVHALDFGSLSQVSSATNTATLESAIGAAAGQGGGDVIVPAGTFPFKTLTLPENVRLRGAHREASVLQSEEGENVVTLSGDRAGLIDITIDGVSLQAQSVGVYAVNQTALIFRDCQIKRFNTGLYCKGGDLAQWQDFYIDNCETGAFLSGDADAGNTGNGGAFEFNEWKGGGITNCTTFGLRVHFEDQITRFNRFKDLNIQDNPDGTAVEINGARYTVFEGCAWSNNVRNIRVQDDSDTSFEDINTVVGVHVIDSYMNEGELIFQGACADVIFRRMSLNAVDYTLTSPENSIVVIDSTEDAAVTVSGESTRLLRQDTNTSGRVRGVTTDDTAVTAWSYAMDAGEVAYAEGKVIGNQRDGEDYAVYHISVGARRPGADLDYDSQVDDFVVGEKITGGASGAVARIIADSDSGSTGTLTLRDIDGTFDDNETITGETQGEAKVNGQLSYSDVVKDSGGDNAIRTAVETDSNWNAAFAVSGGELQLQVTGASSKTVEWTVDIEVLSG